MLEVGRWNLRVPEGGDAPNVPLWMQNLATDLSDVAKDSQGTLAARPVSTVLQPSDTPGRYYFVTGDPDPLQNRRLWRDTGAGWEEMPIGPGSRWELGDYKMSAQTADHGDLGGGAFAWLLCNAREVPVSQPKLVAWLNAHPDGARPFGTGPNGRGLLPDPRGRVPVFRGTRENVNAIGDSEGMPLEQRSPVHHHGEHSHSAFTVKANDNARNNGNPWTGSNDNAGTMDFNTRNAQVGPLGTPLDGPAHLVIGHLFIRAD